MIHDGKVDSYFVCPCKKKAGGAARVIGERCLPRHECPQPRAAALHDSFNLGMHRRAWPYQRSDLTRLEAGLLHFWVCDPLPTGIGFGIGIGWAFGHPSVTQGWPKRHARDTLALN